MCPFYRCKKVKLVERNNHDCELQKHWKTRPPAGEHARPSPPQRGGTSKLSPGGGIHTVTHPRISYSLAWLLTQSRHFCCHLNQIGIQIENKPSTSEWRLLKNDVANKQLLNKLGFPWGYSEGHETNSEKASCGKWTHSVPFLMCLWCAQASSQVKAPLSEGLLHVGGRGGVILNPASRSPSCSLPWQVGLSRHNACLCQQEQSLPISLWCSPSPL